MGWRLCDKARSMASVPWVTPWALCLSLLTGLVISCITVSKASNQHCSLPNAFSLPRAGKGEKVEGCVRTAVLAAAVSTAKRIAMQKLAA